MKVAIVPERWRPNGSPVSIEEFSRVCRPPGAPGEIVVSGPHVLAGYLGGRGDAENKISAGDVRWHRTGDAGYFDAAGRLWLLGRSSATLDDARGRLYPFAVEAAAESCAGVERAALVGAAGRRLLAVQMSNHASAVRSALAHALRFAELDEIRVVSSIPVVPRHNAKIDYARLRRRLG